MSGSPLRTERHVGARAGLSADHVRVVFRALLRELRDGPVHIWGFGRFQIESYMPPVNTQILARPPERKPRYRIKFTTAEVLRRGLSGEAVVRQSEIMLAKKRKEAVKRAQRNSRSGPKSGDKRGRPAGRTGTVSGFLDDAQKIASARESRGGKG